MKRRYMVQFNLIFVDPVFLMYPVISVSLSLEKYKVVEELAPSTTFHDDYGKIGNFLTKHIINIYCFVLLFMPCMEGHIKGRYHYQCEESGDGHTSNDYPCHTSSQLRSSSMGQGDWEHTDNCG
ncbi:Uncharacterised protein [Chlamydia trachomatis]|nr:Uncharacterised protein [Chlamydia trachomatis]